MAYFKPTQLCSILPYRTQPSSVLDYSVNNTINVSVSPMQVNVCASGGFPMISPRSYLGRNSWLILKDDSNPKRFREMRCGWWLSCHSSKLKKNNGTSRMSLFPKMPVEKNNIFFGCPPTKHLEQPKNLSESMETSKSKYHIFIFFDATKKPSKLGDWKSFHPFFFGINMYHHTIFGSFTTESEIWRVSGTSKKTGVAIGAVVGYLPRRKTHVSCEKKTGPVKRESFNPFVLGSIHITWFSPFWSFVAVTFILDKSPRKLEAGPLQ